MMSMLVHGVVPVIHVLCCFFLIAVVLLQTGKGADMGAVFGGGSQTLFGSSGAGNFLTKLTTGTAIVFMLTSLILTWGASRSSTSNLLGRLPATESAPAAAPAIPEPGAEAPVGDQSPAVPIPMPSPGAAPEVPSGAPATP
jgi:preprotein translocase subunit SecG